MQELVLALEVGHYMAREGDMVLQKLTCIRLDYKDSIIKRPDRVSLLDIEIPLAQGPVFT